MVQARNNDDKMIRTHRLFSWKHAVNHKGKCKCSSKLQPKEIRPYNKRWPAQPISPRTIYPYLLDRITSHSRKLSQTDLDFGAQFGPKFSVICPISRPILKVQWGFRVMLPTKKHGYKETKQHTAPTTIPCPPFPIDCLTPCARLNPSIFKRLTLL